MSQRPEDLAPKRLPPDQYRLLVEHHPTMIWRAGVDAKCNYFNETWLAFTGRTAAQEDGDGWAEGVHPDDLSRCVDFYLANFRRREPFEMEYRLRRHDGVYRWVFDRGVPFNGDDGEFAGFIGSCVDVHERREAEAAKASFMAMMAHALRTPITSLKTFLEKARRQRLRGEDVSEASFARMTAQTEKLARLVRDLADTAALEEGRSLDVVCEDVDFGAVLREVLAHHQGAGGDHEAAGPRHTFAVHVEPGSSLVSADRDRLAQIIDNLLENATKYSPRGGQVTVRLERAGTEFVLSVADQGIGIPGGDIPLITRRYFRASNSKPEHYAGIGVGLAIAHELVERLGGRMEVTSVVDEGSTFKVTIPATRGEIQ